MRIREAQGAEPPLGNWARFADAAIAAGEGGGQGGRADGADHAGLAEQPPRTSPPRTSSSTGGLQGDTASVRRCTFVAAGKSPGAFDAVGADADVAHVARRFASWKEEVAAALAEYGPAMDAMLAFVRRVRLRRTMRAFRAHAADSRDVAADRFDVMTRRKRARVYDAWWYVTAATARFTRGRWPSPRR